MPGRNIVKQYVSEHYYHIYTRGVAKQAIFLDDQDYGYFLGLLKRYLSNKPALSTARVVYPWYGNRVDLVSYCLMPNHTHLLIFQHDERAIMELMRSLMTSYSMYFNLRYRRVGPVFQSRYRASIIDHQNYLEHISRYIHLNPDNWQTYEYSSLLYYSGHKTAEWLKPKTILDLFDDSFKSYKLFLSDYQSHKKMLEEMKWELAND